MGVVVEARVTGPCRTRCAPGGKRGNRVEEEGNGMEELEQECVAGGNGMEGEKEERAP